MLRHGVWVKLGCILLGSAVGAAGHELDHFNVPHGRAFADVGDYVTEVYYGHIASAVRKTNARISACKRAGGPKTELERLQSAFTIAEAVCREFPTFVTYIQDLEVEFHSARLQRRYPGLVVAYWPTYCIYDDAIFPLDPRQFYLRWRSSVLLVDGHYVGTDKIGHFLHNGWNYFIEYHRVLRRGGSQEDARRAAVQVGAGDNFLLSERGMLGKLSSGVISNADLAANYMGLLFYLNLTQPVMLQGQIRTPMLELRDGRWRIRDRVSPNSDFMVLFFSDHWDEALNPNLYDGLTARAIDRAIQPHCQRLRMWYVDANGEPRSHAWFEAQAERLQTYYGQDYGHTGMVDGLVSTVNACFCEINKDSPPDARLMAAAMEGDVDSTERALAEGADVEAGWGEFDKLPVLQGTTALHLACCNRYLDVARLLLDHGADVNARTVRGVTPLHLGAGDADMVSLLAGSGAEVDARDALGRSPLYWAAREGASESVDRLLSLGAYPDARDIDGETVLHAAARDGYVEIAENLIRRGASVSAKAMYGTTPLHLAVRHGSSPMVHLLLDADAEVRMADEFGCQPLHDAAALGRREVAVLLIEHGADVHATDIQGRTPMYYAARHNDRLLAERLMASVGRVETPLGSGAPPKSDSAVSSSQHPGGMP